MKQLDDYTLGALLAWMVDNGLIRYSMVDNGWVFIDANTMDVKTFDDLGGPVCG